MLNEYIEQNYTAIFDLFADYTQRDEYTDSELCSEKENERIQFAERLQAAIGVDDNDRCASKNPPLHDIESCPGVFIKHWAQKESTE